MAIVQVPDVIIILNDVWKNIYTLLMKNMSPDHVT